MNYTMVQKFCLSEQSIGWWGKHEELLLNGSHSA